MNSPQPPSQKSQRHTYTARFSAEVVERACRKANWHKARAVKLKRSSHFTAWEWLDLCEARGWQCAYCAAQSPLEPHHRVELHKGGANTIDNIEPICRPCHLHVHEWPDDVSDAWMEYQNGLLRQFQPLAAARGRVRLSCATREENQSRLQGVILELIAPERAAIPLRGVHAKNPLRHPPTVCINSFSRDWWEKRARARIQWRAPRLWEETVMLDHLIPVSDKIEMFAPLQIPLMAPRGRKSRSHSLQNAQMALDLGM